MAKEHGQARQIEDDRDGEETPASSKRPRLIVIQGRPGNVEDFLNACENIEKELSYIDGLCQVSRNGDLESVIDPYLTADEQRQLMTLARALRGGLPFTMAALISRGTFLDCEKGTIDLLRRAVAIFRNVEKMQQGIYGTSDFSFGIRTAAILDAARIQCIASSVLYLLAECETRTRTLQLTASANPDA